MMNAMIDSYPEIRDAVAKLCARFPGEYWRNLDRRMAYPSEFVQALTKAGWLSVLIPEGFGGAGRRDHAGASPEGFRIATVVRPRP